MDETILRGKLFGNVNDTSVDQIDKLNFFCIFINLFKRNLDFIHCCIEAFDGRSDNELDCLWQFEYVPAAKWNVKQVAAFVRYRI